MDIPKEDDDERRAAIRAVRSAPGWSARGEAIAQARNALASASKRARDIDALERLAWNAPPNAVSAAMKGVERWTREAALDSGADEDSIAHDITLSYVSLEIIGARKTAARFGIAAEVLRCHLGWSYAETHEWLLTQ